MRIESCRKCGTELEAKKNCNVCNHVIQFFCHSCGTITDEQIHILCRIKNANQVSVKTSVA